MTTTTIPETTQRTVFIAAAYNAAIDYPVLADGDRGLFRAACDARDLDTAEQWARVVMMRMADIPSMRGAELARLRRLAEAIR